MNKTFMWILIIVMALVIVYFIAAYNDSNLVEPELDANIDTNEIYDVSSYFPSTDNRIVDEVALMAN